MSGLDDPVAISSLVHKCLIFACSRIMMINNHAQLCDDLDDHAEVLISVFCILTPVSCSKVFMMCHPASASGFLPQGS